jgi:hypothetical protein
MRVAPLENLLIALLKRASEPQRNLARDMAAYIVQRSGFTSHPLKIIAAAPMIHPVARSDIFRGDASSLRRSPDLAWSAPG